MSDSKVTKRSRLKIRVEALVRLLLLKFLKNKLPILLITEYPKSGASWLAQMLSEASCMDFPRQKFPSLKPSIFHGHYIFESPPEKTVVFWRDPRDIMVSWYYHCIFKSDKNNHALVSQINERLNFDDVNDIKTNLPRFIEYSFEESLSPKFSFKDFFEAWHGRDDVYYSSYEALQDRPVDELMRLCNAMGLNELSKIEAERIVKKYSFKSQTSRSPGEESKSHYLRKGVVGDWKNHFSQESKKVFVGYTDDILVKLGYEKDDSWLLD